MKKKLKKLILNFKKKAFKSKFDDNFGAKYFYIVGGIVVVTLLIFMFLFNSYSDGLVVDSDGLFISNDSDVLSIKVDNDKKKELSTVSVKAFDTIYKTPLNVYYDSSKKHAINITYPLFSKEGTSLINYNEDVNLINNKFVRSNGYSNMIFSYGKAFDTYGGEVDREKYLFLSYSNGLFINLYDIEINTLNGTYVIPVNSIINFNTDNIKYFEKTDNIFVNKEIIGIDLDSNIRFYFYDIEEFEYTYESLLEGIGSSYRKPEKIDIPDEPVNPEKPDEEIDYNDGDNTGDNKYDEPEFVYVKPTVKSGEFSANVYSINGSIEVDDPSGVITKAPTYTLRVKGKTYLKRTFYGSNTFTISGLTSSTTFDIVGQYTYLDEDMETKKLATFYRGTLTTKDISSLSPIKISHESLYKYPKKVEVNNLEIDSDLKSEAINGIYKISIKIDGSDYYLTPANIQSLISGSQIDASTSNSLKSNEKYNYTVNFYDRENNVIPASNVSGSAQTSKVAPTASLKVSSRDVDYVTISINTKNEDNVELVNYRYEVYDSKGLVIKSDSLEDNTVTLRDLDPNQYYTFKIFANIDLNNGEGVIKNYEIGSMDFTTVPLTSLGLMNFNVNIENVNHEQAKITLQINQRKTDKRLIKLTKKLILNLYDSEDNVVKTLDLSNNELSSLKDGDVINITFDNLYSNNTYKFKLKSTSYQGTVSYESDCITNVDSFETTKIPARVLITNSYTSNTLIDFDVQIVDKDYAIESDYVRFELRDSAGNITNSSKIRINVDPIRMTFNNLSEGKQFFAYFYADSYNETNKNETYKTKYLLTRDENNEAKPLEFWTTNGISGNIELISSRRIANGRNLVDMKSNIKWIENTSSGTLHRTYDSEGNMHIGSRGAYASYQYDLSEYDGKLVKVSFKAKAVKPLTYDIYLNNNINGTTDARYSYKLEGLNSTEFKTYEYSFLLGSNMLTAGVNNIYIPNTGTSYGKKVTNTIGFYINGGTVTPSEFVISNFQVYLYDEEVVDYNPDYQIGTWNGSKPIFASNSTSAKNTEAFVAPEDGYYRFEFNNMDGMYRIYYRVYNLEETAVSSNVGYYTEPTTLRLSKNQKVGLIIQKAAGGLVPDIDEMKENLNLKVIRFYGNPNMNTYEEFSYDLVTKIKLNLVDARNEINNVDKDKCPECHNYYIRTLDNKGNEIKSLGYDDLQGKGSISDVIKTIDLDEKKDYQIELGFKIRDRYYYLDSFDLSTKDEVAGITNSNEFRWIQPYGNYVVLNDIDFGTQSYYLGYEYNKFNGMVDFQGYTMKLNTSAVSYQRKFYHMGTEAVLKNVVLEEHINQTTGIYLEGFVTYNRGLIENVYINVYDDRTSVTRDGRFVLLNYLTYQTGKINNFILNIATPLELHDDASLINFYNRGTISNGYVYGNDVNVETELNASDTTRIASLISYYGYVTSNIKNIYTLTSINFPKNYSYDYTGLIQRNTYGTIENVYVVGDANPENRNYGPIAAVLSASASIKNGYYMSDYTYTGVGEQKVFPLTLRSVDFQKEVLGEDNFEIEDMMEFGYYPHLRFTSNKMPNQPYIELPEADENEVDIVYTEIVSKTDNTAKLLLTINNPHGEKITDVSISDLDTEIESQTFEDGNSYVYVNVSNPKTFTSKYIIRSITSMYADRFESVRKYSEGDKYLFIDFYIQISNVDEWINIKNDYNSNYSIIEDLDFYGYSNYVLETFKGKIKGNNHTLKNVYIDVNKRGLIVNMYGQVTDLNIDGFVKTNYANTYNGLFGATTTGSVIEDVHIKNATIVIPDNVTSDQLVGALVGYAANAQISNCSVNKVTIISNAELSNIEAGGLIGRFTNSTITNSFASNVDINVKNAIYSYGVGGLIGRHSSTEGIVDSCYADGKISSNMIYVGGLIGYTYGYVYNSYANVDVTSEMDQIGGFTGYSYSNSYMVNNLSLGNVFSNYSGGLIGRIAPNVSSNDTYPNTAYSEAMMNGIRSTESMGETLISREELLNKDTYSNVVNMGDEFDYSQVESGILPKLHYAGKEELLPNQEDKYLNDEKFNISNISIEKHPLNAIISITFDNPSNYEITSIVVDDMEVTSFNSTSIEDNKTLVTAEVEPLRYYDSYRLSKVIYNDGSNTGLEADKKYRLDMIFYKELRTVADWQNISGDYAENYRLMNDIDFTGVSPVNTEVMINKLETENDTTNYSLKNMNIEYTKNGTYFGLIRKVVKKLSNINFENINISNTSTGNNNYNDLINMNFGEIKKCNFNDITINSPKKNYVSIIGIDEGKGIEDININNINITANTYGSGLVASHSHSTGVRYIKNVNASNVTVSTAGSYAGGVFATMTGADLAEGIYDISYVTISDSNITSGGDRAGGISGTGDCSYCTVNNTNVTGGQYVGGINGYNKSIYSYENRVNDSTIKGKSNVGGLYGYQRQSRGSYLKNSTVEGMLTSSTNIGGIAGYAASYSVYRYGVLDSTISSNGSYVGGVVGYLNGSTIGYGYVNNSTIFAENYAGGMVGKTLSSNVIYSIVGNSTVEANNMVAGGLIGYINNIEKANGYMYQNLVEKTTVQARSIAGGIYGKRDKELSNLQNSYSLYFEGKVNSLDNINYGIGAGDGSDEEVFKIRQSAFYEYSTINDVPIKNYLSLSDNEDKIVLSEFEDGYINTSNGKIETNYSYYYAKHSDYVKIDAGKTYTINANLTNSRNITFFVVYYDNNKKFLGTGSSGNTYVDRYVSGAYISSMSFKSLRDCYIRFVLYNDSTVNSIEITSKNNNYSGLAKKQLISYDELRNRHTWVDYYSSRNATTYEVSKLSLANARFDLSPLKAEVNNYPVTDLSGNGFNGVANVSAITNRGFIFDGSADYIDIPNFEISKTNNYTIISRYMHANTGTGYVFLYAPKTAVNYGFGLLNNAYEPFMRLNNSNYNTYIDKYVLDESTIAVTYDGTNRILNSYIDGELHRSRSVNNIPSISNSYGARLGMSPSGTGAFSGIVSSIQVYNRVLSEDEIRESYNSSGVTNSEGLVLYYDLTKYENNRVGNYPLVNTNDSLYSLDNQQLIDLPEDPTTLSFSTPSSTSTGLKSSIYKQSMQGKYHVYKSGIDTINIEFDEVPESLKFSYSYGNYKSDTINAKDRVYTLRYDFKSDITFDIKTTYEKINNTYKSSGLASLISIKDGNYYYISNGKLFKNKEEISSNALNIHDNLVLLSTNQIYNIKTGKYQKYIYSDGIVSNKVALFDSNLEESSIKTYYGYSVISKDNESTYRDNQIASKDGNLYIYTDNNKNIVFNKYNTRNYQLALNEKGNIVSYKDEVNLGESFYNAEIEEMSFDINSNDPIIMIRYEDGNIMAINYYNGKVLFESIEYTISLFNYISRSMLSETNNIEIDKVSYKNSNEIVSILNNTKDEDVRTKLGLDDVISSNATYSNNYVIYYDSDSNDYEIIDTSLLLNTNVDSKDVITENSKIKSDAYLYNYFYNKTEKNIIKDSRIYIYIAILLVVIINLVLLGRKVGFKHEKEI